VDPPEAEVLAKDTRRWGEEGGRYSRDGRYRWSFERRWSAGRTICWIGLNPGTGDRDGKYRPTLQRMVDRSVALGMGRIILVNLFAWRSTKPAALRAAVMAREDIVGAECDAAIRAAVKDAEVSQRGAATVRSSSVTWPSRRSSAEPHAWA